MGGFARVGMEFLHLATWRDLNVQQLVGCPPKVYTIYGQKVRIDPDKSQNLLEA